MAHPVSEEIKAVLLNISLFLAGNFIMWLWGWSERAKLAEITKRATGSYFRLDYREVHSFRVPTPDGSALIHTTDQGVLSYWRSEVSNCQDGKWVVLLVENVGEPMVWQRAALDGSAIDLDCDPSVGVTCFIYPYASAKHGQVQSLEVEFQTAAGVQAKHRYETKHGFRHLARIDPS